VSFLEVVIVIWYVHWLFDASG